MLGNLFGNTGNYLSFLFRPGDQRTSFQLQGANQFIANREWRGEQSIRAAGCNFCIGRSRHRGDEGANIIQIVAVPNALTAIN